MPSVASLVGNFNRMSEKTLVSPAGRVNKNNSSSPLDRTVAETPSPGGTDTFSPDSVHVKALPDIDESPAKPFDESSPSAKPVVQPDFEDVWASERVNNSKETVNIKGRMPSYHVRHLNHIMNDIASPDREPVPAKSKASMKAPVPFLSTGSPIQKTQSTNEGEIPLAKNNNSFSPSLADEIALAQKVGMAETLASVPESAQRALMMQSVSLPPVADVSGLASPVELKRIPVSPVEDVDPMRPHSLFQSSEKDENNRSFDEIDRILARGMPGAEEVEVAARPDVLSPLKPWNASEFRKEDSDSDLPFDCTVENMNDLQCLEEGKSAGKVTRALISKVLRSSNYGVPSIALKKEQRGSNVNPNSAMGGMRSLRDYSIHPSEINSSVGKSKKENFEDDTFSPLSFNAGYKGYDPSDPSRRGIRNGSPSDDGNKSSPDEKDKVPRTAVYICLLVVLVIVGIVAGLIAGGKISLGSKGESNQDLNVAISSTWDELPTETSTSTYTPTEFFEKSNIFEGSALVACENSVPLTEMNRTYYGSNWKAFWDPSIDTCGDQMSTGYAVWYSFTTNSSKLVEASTCNNADFDTQITVMTGECGGTTCVSFNDQACGDQSLVTWYAEADTTYYIMVHGFREGSGTFGLTLSDAVHNDQCTGAVKVGDENVVAGTTAGASSFDKPPKCDDVDLSGDGVWYEIDNISGFYKAELLLGYTNFTGQVAVYRGKKADSGCDDLVCDKGSSTGSVMWLAEATETYYVYVTGKNGTAGDFDLFLGRNKDASCTFGTRVDASGVGFLASTEFENPQNVESCGYTGYHTAPGLWFSVVGTGEMLEASTCGSLSDLDTQISVFGNTCDSLECIGGTGQDYPCGANGSVKWQTEVGEVYNIYVSGRSSRVGDFVLTIDVVPPTDGNTCDGSFPLELGSGVFQSNTTDALSASVELCSGSRAVRGVWHTFVGTGKTMKFSVCNDETDFDARISMFTGSCDGLSCVAYTQSTCGQNNEISVATHVGMTYYLFIHGSDSVSIGNYLLTIEEETINDSCAMASSVELTGSPQLYFGNTMSANNSAAIECSGQPISDAGALWYSFVGTGEVVTLSTCSVQTDFSTDIRVFGGGCSEFECVSDVVLTNCEEKSLISFQSVVNEVYHARIGGTNSTNTGNFVLEFNPRSRFFGP